MEKKWDRIKTTIKSLKGLTTIGITNGITIVIVGVFWFYIAGVMGPENYGEVSYFIAISVTASVISFLGAENTLMIYVTKNQKILPPLYLITIIVGIISSIILFFIFYNLWVSLYVIGFVVFNLTTYVFLGRKMYKSYSKHLISQRILAVVFALVFYYMIGPQGVILGFALSFFPFSGKVYQEFKKYKFDITVLKSNFGFVITNYLQTLSRTFSFSADKLIIFPMFGFALLGNYQLGMQLLTVLFIFPWMIYQYVLPHNVSGNPTRKLKIATVIISIFLAILTALLTPIILPFLLPEFTQSIEIIQILCLTLIPTSINLMFISKFLADGKIKITSVGAGIFLLVQISGIFVLGQIYGINGAAASFVLGATAEMVYLIIIERQTRKNDKKMSNLS